MKQNKNILSNILSLISYKDKEQPEDFYIPEINEGQANSNQNKEKDKNVSNSGDSSNTDKRFKKPLPVSEVKKEKRNNTDKGNADFVSTDISVNMNIIKKKFNYPNNKDIVIREFDIAGEYKAFIAYIEGMVDRATINDFILRPLLAVNNLPQDGACPQDYILKSVLEINQARKFTLQNDIDFELLTGNTVLYVNDCDYYVSCETKGYAKRAVDKPQTEGVVRGSQEAFTEDLRTNITLVRKIIKNINLTTEFFTIGKRNNEMCAILYVKGLTNPAIINEVKRRIKGISTDFITGDGMLEQLIEDRPFSVIPTVLTTERPDRTASHLMEGKVAVFTDGAPFTMIVPVTIYSLLHSPEDAGLRWQHGTMLRFIRLIAVAVSVLLPSLYVAITSFHREMIPTDLLIAIVMAKENVPFPTVVEILLMEISFELIREAGIRIPGIIGNTLGIIGALILGQAAVQANIVSPVLIIIIAVTGLGNFAIPNFSLAFGLRIIRFAFIFAGAWLGFYGISLLLVLIMALLFNMKSFGVPFASIKQPKTRRSHDLLLRWPLWMQHMRPDPINALDVTRQPGISRKWTRQNSETNRGTEGEND